MKRRLSAAAVLVYLAAVAGAQSPPEPAVLLEWIPAATKQTSWLDEVKRAIDDLSEFVVRSTSPDMPQERWLWIVSRDGKSPRAVSVATGGRHPRWGKADWVAFESLTDTNGDGRVDADDAVHISLRHVAGGKTLDIGRGRSAIWSPDGRYLAFLRDKIVVYYDVQSQRQIQLPPVGGGLVYTDALSLAAKKRSFWLRDVRKGTVSALAPAGTKYLWLGAVAPDGKSVVFNDNERAAIRIRSRAGTQERDLVRDGSIVVDPSWSPNGSEVIYISTRSP